MKSATRRVVFFPYRHGGRQGALRIDEMSCDGASTAPQVDGDVIVVDGDAVSEVRLELVYELPDLRALVPSDEADAPMVRVILLAIERAPWMRRAIRMDVARGVARGSLTLHAQDVQEVVAVQAQVIRHTQRTGRRGVASDRGARLLESPPLLVRFRERATPIGTFMSVRWQSFGSEPGLRAWFGLPWYLQLTADPPVLWLNSDLTDMARLLTNRAKGGRAGALRDLVFKGLATAAWNQLFDDAVRGLEWDDDGTVRHGRTWHEHVLRHVARHACAEHPRGARTAVLLARAKDARGQQDARALLSEDAARAIARSMDLGSVIDQVCSERS